MLHQPASSITRTLSHIFNHLQNNQPMKISSAYQGSSINIFGDWGLPTQPHILPPHMTSQRPLSCILEQFQTLPKFHNSHTYYKEKVKFCLLKKNKKYFEQVLFMQYFTYFLYMNENVWNFRVVWHKFLDEPCTSGCEGWLRARVHEWYEATVEFACRPNQPSFLRCLRRRVALEMWSEVVENL